MNKNKIQPIVQGAMLASLFGVLALVDAYMGSIIDILFAYVMTFLMGWYAGQYPLKYIGSLFFASAVIVFIVGNLSFWIFSIPTLSLGMYYGFTTCRSEKVKFLGLIIISMIKNYIIFYVLGSLVGISIYQEGLEIYAAMISIVPILKNSISVEISFLLLKILISVAEAYCVYMYTELFRKRIFKKK